MVKETELCQSRTTHARLVGYHTKAISSSELLNELARTADGRGDVGILGANRTLRGLPSLGTTVFFEDWSNRVVERPARARKGISLAFGEEVQERRFGVDLPNGFPMDLEA